MASACVNNIGMSPEKFAPATYPSYGWLSPRVSFSCDGEGSNSSRLGGAKSSSPAKIHQPESSDPVEFEFRLEDPVAMLPADELFSGGKLMPLQVNAARQAPVNGETSSSEIRSPETAKYRRRAEISVADQYVFSPKAPRCSSRWRELLGLKKLYQNASNSSSNSNNNGNGSAHAKSESTSGAATQKTTSSSGSNAPKSLKHFLHRSSKSLSSPSEASLPLLRDSDSESVSISSRLSLSSSSSGHEHEDLPRLSLDSDKPHPNPVFSLHRNPKPARVRTAVKIRETKPRSAGEVNASRAGRSPMRRPAAAEPAPVATTRAVSVDSPRMNSSGKIVFQSLERSSSSPSSLNGGPRVKYRGMERSYSANVRVTPVLNVPVCSLRGSSKSGFGFGQLFSSQQKKDNPNGTVSGKSQHTHYVQQQSHHNRNRTDRN